MDIIYIEHKKAFDKVPHNKLLYKLRKLGVGGSVLEWLRIFFSTRWQCVRISNSYSCLEPVSSGVAQGTLLGPLLFMLYISGVEKAIDDDKCSIIMYADDSKTYGKSNNTEEAEELQINLNRLVLLSEEWQLSINNEKCEMLRISSENAIYQYKIGDNIVPTKNYCRDLGVYVGKDLYYRKHYEIMSRNAHNLCR